MYNRRGFFEKVDILINANDYKRYTLKLLYIDINNFKVINDTYGHEVGDSVLVEFSEYLRRIAPENAIIARLGGDEFVMIYKNLVGEYSPVFDSEVGRINIKNKNDSLEVTFSIGVSDYSDIAVSFDEVLNDADTKMYKTKLGYSKKGDESRHRHTSRV